MEKRRQAVGSGAATDEHDATHLENGHATATDDTASGDGSALITRRRALELSVAGAAAAGAIALRGGASKRAEAADGDPLKLGQPNAAATDTTLVINNADPNSAQIDGFRVEMDRGFTAIYGIAGSGAYGAVRGKNTATGPGMEAESAYGPGLIARSDAKNAPAIHASAETTTGSVDGLNIGSGAGVHGRSTSGPGVLGTGNASGPGVLAESASGGTALQVDGPSTFNGAVTFSQPVQFQGAVQLGELAGIGVIARGSQSVTIANPSITANSVILLTPACNPSSMGITVLSATLWYERQPGKGFKVSLSYALRTNFEFAYFIAKF